MGGWPVGDAGAIDEVDALAGDAFPIALRAAIRASGLSLDRIQYRLRARGLTISVTALSYWQSGRRRPERPESMSALKHLEEVLGVESGSLTALLGPPRPRGRAQRTPAAIPIEALWDNREQLAPLLARMDLASDTSLTRISQHDRVEIAGDRGERSVRVRQVLRAEHDGADRWISVYDVAKPGNPLPRIVPLQSCRLGRVAKDPAAGLIVSELLFDRPLSRGETVIMEYEVAMSGPPYARGDDSFCRKFRLPVRDYVVEMRFDPTDLPAFCHQVSTPADDPDAATRRDLVVDSAGRTHAVVLGFGPGTFTVEWGWVP
ncbi:helix-turn-helix domain-containing protein [Kibdelosporangium philippinense]|uniref:Helix-turn-helix domain-containing protein n=1 Tax=Kibdelosporangium philippinense TaxID=211113 RepID=A0ABS8ZS28_9PSEU|nr:helix-turn-helix domain-containing protein [Kibdelosporangium philippinense]MCE7010549.1 helix-turn-helix domain-containing protein [Kibdelosporangium philippinense]